MRETPASPTFAAVNEDTAGDSMRKVILGVSDAARAFAAQNR